MFAFWKWTFCQFIVFFQSAFWLSQVSLKFCVSSCCEPWAQESSLRHLIIRKEKKRINAGRGRRWTNWKLEGCSCIKPWKEDEHAVETREEQATNGWKTSGKDTMKICLLANFGTFTFNLFKCWLKWNVFERKLTFLPFRI